MHVTRQLECKRVYTNDEVDARDRRTRMGRNRRWGWPPWQSSKRVQSEPEKMDKE